MRHLEHARTHESARRTLVTALVTVAVTVAGCGSDSRSSDLRGVVDDCARGLMRDWCPDAAARHGRDLGRRRARRCLARVRRAWLAELRREGFSAKRVGGGP